MKNQKEQITFLVYLFPMYPSAGRNNLRRVQYQQLRPVELTLPSKPQGMPRIITRLVKYVFKIFECLNVML
jgi:hypothetical protein